jgi:hypothetical protein
MSGMKKQSVNIGYSTFIDDMDDGEYESCSGDDAEVAKVIAASSSAATSLPQQQQQQQQVISARVVTANSFNSPVQRASPVVTGARVVTPGRPNARLVASAPVNLMSTPVSHTPVVVSARVVSPVPQRQQLQQPTRVVIVGQPTFVSAAPVMQTSAVMHTHAPVVVSSRIVSRP